MQGQFITFEGIDGSGKTTLVKKLESWLTSLQIPNITTREPGGSNIGQEIRQVLLSNQNLEVMTQVMLVMADRFQHQKDLIEPAMKENKIILCDRFFDSTLAYQGGGYELNLDWLLELSKEHVMTPNWSILLDIEPKIMMDRIKKKNIQSTNYLDFHEPSFYQRTRDKYLEVANKNDKRYSVIDASKSIEDTFQKVKELFAKKYNLSTEYAH